MSDGLKNFKNVSEEVLYPENSDIISISQADIRKLIDDSETNPRKRLRICAHANPADKVHEMLIVHKKATYVRPHKHFGRSESFHVILGRADVVVFSDEGHIIKVIEMGDFNSGKNFYYRLNDSRFHTLLIYSEHLVFQETTRGPFDPEGTAFAPWAPLENDADSIAMFMAKVSKAIKDYDKRNEG